MKSRGELGREVREPHLFSSLAFIFSHRFPLAERLEQATTKCAVLLFFFQVISRHVELQGKSYPLEQQQQVIAYNTMFE